MNEDAELSSAGTLPPCGLPLKSPGAFSATRFDFPLHSVTPSGSIYTDTVAIFVDSDWSSSEGSNFGPFFVHGKQIQLCPAIFVPTAQHIPQAVKHIFSRLASSAKELDQGVPELLLSLGGSGNSLNFEVSLLQIGFFFNLYLTFEKKVLFFYYLKIFKL